MRGFLKFVKENAFTCAVIIWAIMLSWVVFIRLPYDEQAAVPAEAEIVYETVYIEKEIEVPVSNAYYKNIAESITDKEIDLLAKVLQLEAGNQSVTGQRAVVEVIFNRVCHEEFPDTVEEVLLQKGQFSTIKLLHRSEPTETQYAVISAVLEEVSPILPEDVVFFATSKANGTFYERIGNHYFCRI